MDILDKLYYYEICVQWDDLDMAGVVYHPNYLKFCDRSRSAQMRELGYPIEEFYQNVDAFMIVSSVDIKYHHSARLGDIIRVYNELLEFKKFSFKERHMVMKGDKLLFEAVYKFGLVNSEGKPVQFEDRFRNKCIEYLEEINEAKNG